MSLATAARFLIPRALVLETETALREAGADGYERFVLWTGALGAGAFTVQHMHVPEQQAYRSREGVCVTVEGEALHRLNVWLYENGELLGVQVHTHPTDAYHSETDDRYAIVTALGGASLVIPNFAEGPLLGSGCAAYRWSGRKWVAVEPDVLEVI